MTYPTIQVAVPDAPECRRIIRQWLDDNGVTLREFGVDCPDCGGGDSTCLYCDGTGTVIE
jgi:hypothetical protein